MSEVATHHGDDDFPGARGDAESAFLRFSDAFFKVAPSDKGVVSIEIESPAGVICADLDDMDVILFCDVLRTASSVAQVRRVDLQASNAILKAKKGGDHGE